MKKTNLALSIAALFMSFTAHSQIITVDFTGSVTAIGSMLTGDGVAVGSGVTGSFSYDTNILSGVVDTFSVGFDNGFLSTIVGTGNMTVQNDQQNGSATLPADGLTVNSFNTSSSSLNGYTNPAMQFGLLRDNVDGQLWSDTLPPDLSDWAGITLADINNPDWHWMDFGLVTTNFLDDQIRWKIDSYNVSAVPVPAAVWLFMSGIVGLGAVARKRRL